MEDYKKKYEEALERAIKLASQPTVWSSDDICQKIFPELKESEDDIMRKMAIHAVYSPEAQSCIKSWGINPSDVIAWLEKQGEQQNKVSIWKHWNNGIAGNGECELIYLVKSGNTYSLSSCLSFECDYIELSELDKLYVEKQGEQKPADNVIKPKFHEGDIIKPKDGCHEPWKIMQVDISDKKYRFKDGYVIHFSQEDNYELVEQKPAWTGYDEKAYEIALLDIDKSPSITKNDTIDWLKSLKNRVQLQPKQEWSEEDEKIIKNLSSIIVANSKNNYLGHYYTPDLITKLQSLRHSRKLLNQE